MRRTILILFCCSVYGYGFSQPLTNKDSVKSSTGSIDKSIKNIKPTPGLNIFPNPAKNKITLQVKNFEPGMATVKVLNIKGELVKADNRLLTNGNEDIVMFLMIKPGVYFIQVSKPGKITRKKIVIL